MLSDWVDRGGNLIAMRPDPDLAGLLGLTDSGTDLSDALPPDRHQRRRAGCRPRRPDDPVPRHGRPVHADGRRRGRRGAVLERDGRPPANPAVTLRIVGTNGGQAAAFAYDLARRWSTRARAIRPGRARSATASSRRSSAPTTCSSPTGSTSPRSQIPQADEQQRLLANLIEHDESGPDAAAALLVLPARREGGRRHDRRRPQRRRHRRPVRLVRVAAARRLLASTTGSASAPPRTSIRARCSRSRRRRAYEAQGFEIAPPRQHRTAPTGRRRTLEGFYDSQLAAFAAYPARRPRRTNRTHCITWSDWATQPKVELDHGIRLDTNYYYWPAAWVQNRPGMFTGSGMPMRFADLDGSLIDVYQAATQMTDESGMTYSTHINTLLDNAIGAPGYYGAFTMNMHTDNAQPSGRADRRGGRAGPRCPRRVRTPDADLARRPQRIVVRRPRPGPMAP